MLSMTFKVSRFFLLAVSLLSFTSCVSDKQEININVSNSTLNIHTRSVDNTADEKISYPIYIYVLDNNDHCVEQTVITSDIQPISFYFKKELTMFMLWQEQKKIYTSCLPKNQLISSATCLCIEFTNKQLIL